MVNLWVLDECWRTVGFVAFQGLVVSFEFFLGAWIRTAATTAETEFYICVSLLVAAEKSGRPLGRCERNGWHFCLVQFDPVCGYHSASHCPCNCENPLSSRSGFLFPIVQAPGISRNSIVPFTGTVESQLMGLELGLFPKRAQQNCISRCLEPEPELEREPLPSSTEKVG